MNPHKCLFIWILLAVFALPGCGSNPEKTKHATVAIVSAGNNFNQFIEGFKEGLAKAGYREGKNITYLYDGPTPAKEIGKRLTALKQQEIDLLYTTTTPVTLKAKKIFAGSKIPILFAPVFSPVDAGLVDAKTRCGDNITGVMVRGSTEKTLGYLLECMPELKTIFVPYHQHELPARLNLKDLQKEADRFGITILTANIKNKNDINNVLQNIPKETDCLWVTHSSLIVNNADAIINAAAKRNLPVASPTAQAQKGALLSYAPTAKSMGKQASKIAAKILRGADASLIPAETAEYFLGINLKTANALGIDIRDDLLRQADFIER